MSNDDKSFLHSVVAPVACIFGSFVLWVAACLLKDSVGKYQRGRDYQQALDQKAAIAAGVAHWTVNPTTGERKFEFLKP